MTDLTYSLDMAHDTAFEIDNDVTADRMLRDVIKNNQERDRLLKLADDMIAQYQAQKAAIASEFERKNEWNLMALRTYFNKVEKHETKTQASYRLISGRLVQKKQQPTYNYDNDALTAWAFDCAPMFVKEKTTTSVDWAGLKQLLTVKDGKAYYTETGEAMPITIVERPDLFVVEGGKNA